MAQTVRECPSLVCREQKPLRHPYAIPSDCRPRPPMRSQTGLLGGSSLPPPAGEMVIHHQRWQVDADMGESVWLTTLTVVMCASSWATIDRIVVARQVPWS